MDRNKKIFTIGHSTLKTDEYLRLLREHLVDCIVDVRSTPYSRFAPQYNREELKPFLLQNKICYIFMGVEFGARRTDASLYSAQGVLDFEKTAKSRLFLEGIQRINKGTKDGFIIALMCTEKNPVECHRSILVSRSLRESGYEVCHILHDGKIQSQEMLERELVDTLFPNRLQGSLFDEGNVLSFSEYLSKAYRLQNQRIGYHLDSETVEKSINLE